MPRTPASFKKTEVVRLIEALRSTGFNVKEVRLKPDGTVSVFEDGVPAEALSDFERYETEL